MVGMVGWLNTGRGVVSTAVAAKMIRRAVTNPAVFLWFMFPFLLALARRPLLH
jgi:hypothetical protein